ncbi:hypothetical protein [Natrialba taiwanensis]|nr:hypothetical protein [Natrialba taiwanensis]
MMRRGDSSDRQAQPRDRPRTETCRRRLLRWGSLVGLTSLSGCTADIGEEFPPNEKWPTADLAPSLPVSERSTVLENGIEAMAPESIADEAEFETAIDEYGIDVETVERDRDVLTIEYAATERYETSTLHTLGPIAGAFAALVDAGYDATALAVTILDPAPDSFGEASIERPWAEAYLDGDLSAAEYGELVATTVASERHPPDVEVSPSE